MEHDKFQELMINQLVSITQELASFKADTQEELASFRADTKEELARINQSLVRIEQTHGEKIRATFDGQMAANEKLDQVITRLDIIESKIESHDIRIAVLDKRRKHAK